MSYDRPKRFSWDSSDFDHNWLEGGPGADVDTSIYHDSNAAVEVRLHNDVDNRVDFLTEFK